MTGRLNVRGHAGHPFRWGFSWFWEMRDGGLPWSFAKNDRPAVDLRITLLLDLFANRQRPDMISAIVDGIEQLAIQNYPS